jgi:phosphoribosyl 1,2-cyclic phosphate phosphodiesterase
LEKNQVVNTICLFLDISSIVDLFLYFSFVTHLAVKYPEIKITFLGTGTSTGVPMIACDCQVCNSKNKKDKRLRSSILVQSNTTTIVVDTTPDFRYQMLRQKIKQLDAVLFTHSHKDHIAGLDDVRAYNFFGKKPMDVYATEMTQQALKREFHYVFAEKTYPGIPKINLHTIDLQPFVIGDIPIIPILVYHMHMPVLGFRFGSFTYITDAKTIEEQEKDKIRGSKIIVLNALRQEEHISHLSLADAVNLTKELDVPAAYFTHVSHQMGLHQEVNKLLPEGIQLAWDGLSLAV